MCETLVLEEAGPRDVQAPKDGELSTVLLEANGDKVDDQTEDELLSSNDGYHYVYVKGEPIVSEHWVNLYYEALTFYFWEPQHLGRSKAANTKLNTLAKVMTHVESLEVSLNHLLKQFFYLAPDSLRNKLFVQILGHASTGSYFMQGREEDLKLRNAMQPDFLFTSPGQTVSIEMKLNAKATLKQIQKYALLALAVELSDGRQRDHALVLLGPGSFVSLWAGAQFQTPQALCEALIVNSSIDFLNRYPKLFSSQLERYRGILRSLDVAFVTYSDLYKYILQFGPNEHDLTPGAEVYRKLIRGLGHELDRRKLI